MARNYSTVWLPITLAALTSALVLTEQTSARTKDTARGPVKQIFEVSPTIMHSQILNVDGVAAYVVSAMGSNRGILVKDINSGIASDMGIGPGDVILSFNSHVVQTANDADSVLGGIPSGNVRVMFVHPGAGGLQLYNAQFRYTNTLGSGSRSMAKGGGSRSGGASAMSSSEPDFRPSVEAYDVELINQDRHSNGVTSSVHMNSALQAIAKAHAMDMIRREFFNHVNPDGMDPQARAKAAGITGGVYENIAMEQSNQSDSAKAIKSEASFMAEPPNQQNHRGNILHPKHVAVGVGVAVRGNKMILVQDYADYDP